MTTNDVNLLKSLKTIKNRTRYLEISYRYIERALFMEGELLKMILKSAGPS